MEFLNNEEVREAQQYFFKATKRGRQIVAYCIVA